MRFHFFAVEVSIEIYLVEISLQRSFFVCASFSLESVGGFFCLRKIGSRYVLRGILGSLKIYFQKFFGRNLFVKIQTGSCRIIIVKSVNTFNGHGKVKTFDIAP